MAAKRKSKPPAANSAVRSRTPFITVGIGASAGGLEAFTQLLSHLPADTGMAFVLVQHLDPHHESALVQILAKIARMPVQEVTHELKIEPNHVYVIPPNVTMTISGGILRLSPAESREGPLRSIDSFFQSLAADQRERAIGVVLSGTASDGTLGLGAIREVGGFTFAQDESAKYDSMPHSAVAAGCVDSVLPPEQIAKELTRIARHPLAARGLEEPDSARTGKNAAPDATTKPQRQISTEERSKPSGKKLKSAVGHLASAKSNALSQVLLLLRNYSGVDFSLYKSTTIERRIARRIMLNKLTSINEYAGLLKENTEELGALHSDMLINVTNFFRNPDAFESLKEKVFPELIERMDRDEPLRIWVLGCSTGQEAYSLAMAFMEATDHVTRLPKLQVFATDLSETLLQGARQGLYTKSLVADVSSERLRRFFVEEQGGYRVTKALRDQVIFAKQNVIADPPFSRMHMISCRNLLIYLDPGIQNKILPNFHYALKPGGFLFLGASESIGPLTGLFKAVDPKHKIFMKKMTSGQTYELPASKENGGGKPRTLTSVPVARPESFRVEMSAQREADRVTMNQFAPPGVLVNADLEILQFRGSTGSYIEPAAGKASLNVLKMARSELVLPLRSALNKAKRDNKPVLAEGVRVTKGERTRLVNIRVIPLKTGQDRSYLIMFLEHSAAGNGHQPDRGGSGATTAKREGVSPVERRVETSRIAELERELSEMRDYLQSIQEQHDATSEEIQAQNEEVQSANEELQSINEELETSKEELESANEELTTVNEELSTRNAELGVLNNDLSNLHVSIDTAIVLLGRDLSIRRFTKAAELLFNLQPANLGHSFRTLRHNLMVPDLEKLVAEVIDTVSLRELEVQDTNGSWYNLRIRPYLTLDNKIDGAVLVLTDIDQLKRSEQEIKIAREYLQTILNHVSPLLILDNSLRVVSANESFYRSFKVSPESTVSRLVYDLGNRQWDIPLLRALLEEILPRQNIVTDFEISHDFEEIGQRTMLLNAQQLDSVQQILLTFDDITERLQFQAELRQSEMRYRRLFETAHDGILIIDPGTRTIIDANPFITQLLGYERDELLGKELWQIGLIKDEAANKEAFQELKERGLIRYEDLPLRSKSGDHRDVEFVSNMYEAGNRTVIQCNIRDITERKMAEGALLQAKQRLSDQAALLENLVQARTQELQTTSKQLETFVYSIAHDLRAPLRGMEGYAQALREDYSSVLGEEGRAYTSKIAESAQRLDRLLNDLLEYSRISQSEISLLPVQMEHVVDTVLESLRGDIDRRKAQVIVERPLSSVRANQAILVQVLVNLLTNAMKFVASGIEPRIRIWSEMVAENVRLCVEDNGIGISSDQLKRVFLVFEQGHPSEYAGTGIGLAIVQKGIERMHGHVGVESIEGSGSRFFIELPAVRRT